MPVKKTRLDKLKWSITLKLSEDDDKVLSFEIILMDGPSAAGWLKCSQEQDEQWNDAFLHSDYRGRGLGKLMLLAAVYSAQKCWDGFRQDSRGVSDSQFQVYSSLMFNRLITRNGGRFTVTDKGKRFWKSKRNLSLNSWFRQFNLDLPEKKRQKVARLLYPPTNE